jgi:tetratricopeptide (TPR) repeat protein
MKKRPLPLVQKSRHNPQSASRLLNLLARPLWTGVLLAIITTVVYWPAVGFDYVTYDDPKFIITNPHVLGGLTWENVRWAFGTGLDSNWIPLTWLSYMLDVEWSGPTATGLHLTNILLHAANTVLVFLLFRRLTGMHWPSAVLAGLFGLHPLHVESVAWVAERKDVLSTLFWSLAIWMYARYAQGPAGGSPRWSNGYFPALVFFALGLMSKPMVVTLPFALLLLDYWPLRRIGAGNLFAQRAILVRLTREKIPFFLLAAVMAGLTFSIHVHRRTVEPLASRPFGMRIANAMIAYSRYLAKTFWPVDLANPYPLLRHWPWEQVLGAGALLIGLSVLAVLTARKRPYGLAGWLWFLGTLIPVIGLVQVGAQAMADRYTYIPLLGVFWIGIWAAADLIARWRPPGIVVALAALLVLGTCATQTRAQLDHWRDGESLFRHTIASTQNNFIALDGLGDSILNKQNKQRLDEAMFYELKALEIRPGFEFALTNLDKVLVRIDAFYAVTNHPPAPWRQSGADYAYAHSALGVGLAMNGKLDEAIPHFRKALFYDPDNMNARCNLGRALMLQGRLEEAIGQCEQVLRQSPHNPQALNILGFALLQQGKLDQAVAHLREALQYQPDYPEAHAHLGQALARLGQQDEAIAHFKEALRLNPNYRDAREQLKKLESVSK